MKLKTLLGQDEEVTQLLTRTGIKGDRFNYCLYGLSFSWLEVYILGLIFGSKFLLLNFSDKGVAMFKVNKWTMDVIEDKLTFIPKIDIDKIEIKRALIPIPKAYWVKIKTVNGEKYRFRINRTLVFKSRQQENSQALFNAIKNGEFPNRFQ